MDRRQSLTALLAATLAPAASWAQDFPSKPVKLIVGFTAGGTIDVTARIIGQQLQQKLHWRRNRIDGGDVLIGEVSTVNDDETDNIFREPIGRFAEIEEDVAPTHLLVSDYDAWLPR